MNDLLTITDLELWTRIGVPLGERQAEQRLLVTVEMACDVSAAAKTDDVKKFIDYAGVTEDLKTLARTERKTIERFAEDVAQMILKKHGADAVSVSVKKFAIPGAKNVHVTIHRIH